MWEITLWLSGSSSKDQIFSEKTLYILVIFYIKLNIKIKLKFLIF